jgi:hypothetical protein
MGPGGIATIIAAVSLFVIAIAIAYTVDTTPLLNESTRTLELINGPLESIAKITKNVEEVTSKVTGATTGFMESPTGRVAGALLGAATLSKGRKSKKKSD